MYSTKIGIHFPSISCINHIQNSLRKNWVFHSRFLLQNCTILCSATTGGLKREAKSATVLSWKSREWLPGVWPTETQTKTASVRRFVTCTSNPPTRVGATIATDDHRASPVVCWPRCVTCCRLRLVQQGQLVFDVVDGWSSWGSCQEFSGLWSYTGNGGPLESVT